ncbi:MAG: Gfo/Idh/MocA family oxidoreductase [Selenomonadaceae bacterium]|nr:Gfo/Idh/MocA family oxidoreductase [Selenomonadaceae bacterium]
MGFNRVTDDWKKFVNDPDIDLVDIATPNAFHYQVAKAALEAGKNVYCETIERYLKICKPKIRKLNVLRELAGNKPLKVD